MTPFLINKAAIILIPDPDWFWAGWDGRFTIYSQSKALCISGDNIIIETDVPLFSSFFSPRQYTTLAFSIPGTIATAAFTVNKQTLSDKIKVQGFFPLLLTSTGKFICNFAMPAMQPSPGGPIPDPVVVKSGTWEVIEANQKIFFTNRGTNTHLIREDVSYVENFILNKSMGGEKNIFNKEIINVKQRKGRKGEPAVKITFKDGSTIDIKEHRVKQFIPNPHPKAPIGGKGLAVIFKDPIPGTKGKKRLPTQEEIEFLKKIIKNENR